MSETNTVVRVQCMIRQTPVRILRVTGGAGFMLTGALMVYIQLSSDNLATKYIFTFYTMFSSMISHSYIPKTRSLDLSRGVSQWEQNQGNNIMYVLYCPRNNICCDVICKTHTQKQTTKTFLVIDAFTDRRRFNS